MPAWLMTLALAALASWRVSWRLARSPSVARRRGGHEPLAARRCRPWRWCSSATVVSLLVGLPLGVWAAKSDTRQPRRAAGARFHADDARLRLPDPGGDVLRAGQGAGHHRHHHLLDAAGRAPDQPRHPPGAQGAGGGGARLRLHAAAAPVQGADPERAAVDHGGREPEHHARPVDGGHRLDDRRRRPRQRGAARHPASGHGPRLRRRHRRRAAGDHPRPHHPELRRGAAPELRERLRALFSRKAVA